MRIVANSGCHLTRNRDGVGTLHWHYFEVCRRAVLFHLESWIYNRELLCPQVDDLPLIQKGRLVVVFCWLSPLIGPQGCIRYFSMLETTVDYAI